MSCLATNCPEHYKGILRLQDRACSRRRCWDESRKRVCIGIGNRWLLCRGACASLLQDIAYCSQEDEIHTAGRKSLEVPAPPAGRKRIAALTTMPIGNLPCFGGGAEDSGGLFNYGTSIAANFPRLPVIIDRDTQGRKSRGNPVRRGIRDALHKRKSSVLGRLKGS